MNNSTYPLVEFLQQHGVAHRVLPHRTPTKSIEETAEQRGIRTCQMVKSIGLRDMDNNYALACVPGNRQADPKKVRALLNSRRMTCLTAQELVEITGYQLGCVTPLALKTPMPIFFDPSLLAETEVTISSGSNMAGIALNCQDLINLCQPTIADICRD
ncbi:YbaK/EbsC family protein [Vibrio sp. SCSIO 43136]|uniref:aminoacyl-tRNA deacylase n=1 Tax=Vibrio sp. SCSIO 43136 TaxID=2819101 RepID=UPI002076295A|nr:YbaK/EbsC family protein [Vibrio sp. SCSIO 43136]USD65645.1 YbaK/EbsC family protein [Vibrio sp. SCSIO 43136]